MSVRPTTLRGRLTLWYTAISTVMVTLLGVTSLFLLDRALHNNVDNSLNSLAQAMAESVKRSSVTGSSVEESLQGILEPDLVRRFFQLLDPLGQPDTRLATREQSKLPLSADALRNAAEGRSTFETIQSPRDSKASFRLLTYPVIENGSLVNIVQAAMSLDNVEATRSRFLFVLLILSPLVLLGSAWGGWFLGQRALAPVNAIVDTARKIEAEDLSRRIPSVASADELGRLVAVLNDMLARLEQSFGAVSRFSSDAAHELRTPLTILKGEIEMALRATAPDSTIGRTLVSCLEEVDRLNSLIETLLLMARMEGNALTTPSKPVNLAQVLDDVAPALNELARRSGNFCRVSVAGPLWVEGYDSLLFRLIFNLAENAIKYTPNGGRIDVTVHESTNDAVLEVRDNGPGIDQRELAHIFDRFYRGDRSKEGGGAGLGLALVKSIVQLHHGAIQVTSTSGEGSSFRVNLPLIPPPIP